MRTVGASRWQHKLNPLIALKLPDKDETALSIDSKGDAGDIDFCKLRNFDSTLQGSYKVRVNKLRAPRARSAPPSSLWQELDSSESFVDDRGINKKVEFEVEHEEIDWDRGVNQVGRFRIKDISAS
ncbi:hypothetical protein KEM56_000281 [Ascosphaera pollenicola]|nr:hypothetical protein KEM56_000281 [Ascosphaera pollenicola]